MRSFASYWCTLWTRLDLHSIVNMFGGGKLMFLDGDAPLWQGRIQRGGDWNWETIFYGRYRSIFNHCDAIKFGEKC